MAQKKYPYLASALLEIRRHPQHPPTKKTAALRCLSSVGKLQGPFRFALCCFGSLSGVFYCQTGDSLSWDLSGIFFCKGKASHSGGDKGRRRGEARNDMLNLGPVPSNSLQTFSGVSYMREATRFPRFLRFFRLFPSFRGKRFFLLTSTYLGAFFPFLPKFTEKRLFPRLSFFRQGKKLSGMWFVWGSSFITHPGRGF